MMSYDDVIGEHVCFVIKQGSAHRLMAQPLAFRIVSCHINHLQHLEAEVLFPLGCKHAQDSVQVSQSHLSPTSKAGSPPQHHIQPAFCFCSTVWLVIFCTERLYLGHMSARFDRVWIQLKDTWVHFGLTYTSIPEPHMIALTLFWDRCSGRYGPPTPRSRTRRTTRWQSSKTATPLTVQRQVCSLGPTKRSMSADVVQRSFCMCPAHLNYFKGSIKRYKYSKKRYFENPYTSCYIDLG